MDNATWLDAMDRAGRWSRKNGKRYRVTGRRHTFPLGGVLWIYRAEEVR